VGVERKQEHEKRGGLSGLPNLTPMRRTRELRRKRRQERKNRSPRRGFEDEEEGVRRVESGESW
jgi:hypothetical protein